MSDVFVIRVSAKKEEKGKAEWVDQCITDPDLNFKNIFKANFMGMWGRQKRGLKKERKKVLLNSVLCLRHTYQLCFMFCCGVVF